MELGKYQGDDTIAFGIVKLPYDEKEIIQKAQYYYSGKRYDETKRCIFHSGNYYMELFTENLSNMDIENLKFQDSRLDREYITKTYKNLYVRIIKPE